MKFLLSSSDKICSTFQYIFIKASENQCALEGKLIKQLHCRRSQQFTMEKYSSSSSCVSFPRGVVGFVLCWEIKHHFSLTLHQPCCSRGRTGPAFNLGEMGLEGATCSSGQGRESWWCAAGRKHILVALLNPPQWKGQEQPSPRVPAELQEQLHNNFS